MTIPSFVRHGLLAVVISAVILNPLRATQAATNYTLTAIVIPGGSAQANGVNDAGQVVGNFGSEGFLYSGGAYTIINAPGAVITALNSINNAGQIVGFFTDVNGSHGLLYSGGTFTTIDEPNAANGTTCPARGTQLFGINNVGQIVGNYTDADCVDHGFLYSGGSFTTLDAPGASTNAGITFPYGINDAGQIVGYFSGSTGRHGFLYSGGSFTMLDAPGSVNYTFPYGINNAGQIVGEFVNSAGNNGFLYTGGNYTIPIPGDASLRGINNVGQLLYISGTSFLATPSSGSPPIAVAETATTPAGTPVMIDPCLSGLLT